MLTSMKRSGAVIVVAAVSVVAVAATSRPTTASAEAAGNTLAFIRNGEIRVTGLGSSVSRRLTYADGDVGEIAWSPDGRTIAFVRSYEGQSYSEPEPSEISVIGADGSSLRRLTPRLPDVHGIVWSPDGRRLAFEQRDGGVFRVFVMSLQGQVRRQLAPRLPATDSPSWAPNGRKIVVSGTTTPGRLPIRSAIYTLDSDGRNLRQLTRKAEDTRPIWSPNGRRVLYERNRSVIRVMNADGSAHRGLAGGTLAAWSPDGGLIAFVRPGNTGNDIWTMSADGKRLRRLATNTYGPGPAWSPDGKMIAFVANNSIFVMNADGSRQRKVISEAITSAWRPVS
jgi:TolB protein